MVLYKLGSCHLTSQKRLCSVVSNAEMRHVTPITDMSANLWICLFLLEWASFAILHTGKAFNKEVASTPTYVFMIGNLLFAFSSKIVHTYIWKNTLIVDQSLKSHSNGSWTTNNSLRSMTKQVVRLRSRKNHMNQGITKTISILSTIMKRERLVTFSTEQCSQFFYWDVSKVRVTFQHHQVRNYLMMKCTLVPYWCTSLSCFNSMLMKLLNLKW